MNMIVEIKLPSRIYDVYTGVDARIKSVDDVVSLLVGGSIDAASRTR